jgi:hypothetical protein
MRPGACSPAKREETISSRPTPKDRGNRAGPTRRIFGVFPNPAGPASVRCLAVLDDAHDEWVIGSKSRRRAVSAIRLRSWGRAVRVVLGTGNLAQVASEARTLSSRIMIISGGDEAHTVEVVSAELGDDLACGSLEVVSVSRGR